MLKHGEFVAPEIALLNGQETKPNKVSEESLSGVQRRFSKRAKASTEPSALGNVTVAFKEAMAFGMAGGSAQGRGVMLMAALVMICLGVWLVPMFIPWAIDLFSSWNHPFLMLQAIVAGFLIFYLYPRWFYALLKLDLFGLDDQPVVFDRANRKVYRLFPPLDGSAEAWGQRLRKRPVLLQAAEYDWDCIEGEYRATLAGTGKTVSRMHSLTLVVRDYPKEGEKEGRLLDEFDVGNSLSLGPTTVPMLWEHIRRFMEEKGPAVPKGEPMQVFERPRNLWQSMGVVSPFGPRFLWWWRTNRFITVIILLTFPVTLPFALLWSTCNWISHMTMRETIWPRDVLERVGQPVRGTARFEA